MKEEVQGFDVSGYSAVLIGCGGLGCNVGVHLAGAGIGKLYVCDFDTVSLFNLNRQFLFTPADEGKSKAAVIAERLGVYAPESEIVPVEKKITAVRDLAFAAGCDIMIIAADNNEVRRICGEFCREHRMPVVNGGISGSYGICYLQRENDPCFDCAGITAACEKKIYSVSTAAGVIGALSAETAIAQLLGRDTPGGGRLMIYDGGEIRHMRIVPSKQCRICSAYK